MARKVLAAAWVVAASLSLGTGAKAARAPMVVVVEGPGADAVTGWIEDRLNAPDTLEEEETFRRALRSRWGLPLHGATTDAARNARLIACAHAAAGEADVGGAMLVDLERDPAGTRIHVWTIDAHPGGAVLEKELTLSASASPREESRAILAASKAKGTPVAEPEKPAPPPRPAIVRAEAPPSPPAGPTQAPDKVASVPPPDRAGALLALQGAFGVGMRRFSYVDRVTPSLRPYNLAAAPMASASAVVYPMGRTGVPVLRDFGITGDYSQAFAISSQDSTGAQVGTSWRSFDVGATERIPVGRSLVANLSLGYGGNDFQFDQGAAGAVLPSVAYRFVRAGGDLRVALLSALSVFGGASYLQILETGYTASVFPRESVGGVDGHLGASWLLAKSWEVSLAGSYTRVFYSVNPVPGDASVAGGALDEQTRILAGLSYVM